MGAFDQTPCGRSYVLQTRQALPEFGIIRCLYEIGAGAYPFNLPARHLFTRSDRRTGWTRWIPAHRRRAEPAESFKSRRCRATRNANRVYHYDPAGYRLAGYTPRRRFVCFTVRYPRFNVSTLDRPSQRDNQSKKKRELRRILEGNEYDAF